MEWTPKAQRFFTTWSAEIRHEWLRSGMEPTEAESAAIHLALFFLVELHCSLQQLLDAPGTPADQTRVLQRLSTLRDSPVIAHLPACLERAARSLALVHPRPIRVLGERHTSFTHALLSHRESTARLFGAVLLLPDLAEIDVAEFVDERRKAHDQFRADTDRVVRDAPRFDFFVVANNGCFSGRDLHAYEGWLASKPRLDFRSTASEGSHVASIEPLRAKVLQHLLGVTDTTLLKYRKKAGLPIGRPGKRVIYGPDEVVMVCCAFEQKCANSETLQKASELKAKYLPSRQNS